VSRHFSLLTAALSGHLLIRFNLFPQIGGKNGWRVRKGTKGGVVVDVGDKERRSGIPGLSVLVVGGEGC
jgi:hypothetical protein